ncbi:MAG: alternative ribosome rescue aminoacyl-tRNA hydrolase ArfB [Candidatus Paceibacterota bacterium]|jgi:ribosome-associated protein
MNRENLEKENTDYFCEVGESAGFSSGPGGQNVNKRATRIELRWKVMQSAFFSDEEKARILEVLANRINKAGELIVTAQKERSQSRNREIAYERLNELIQEALVIQEERIPTKPTAGSQERRIEEKKAQSFIKNKRRKPEIEE